MGVNPITDTHTISRRLGAVISLTDRMGHLFLFLARIQGPTLLIHTVRDHKVFDSPNLNALKIISWITCDLQLSNFTFYCVCFHSDRRRLMATSCTYGETVSALSHCSAMLLKFDIGTIRFAPFCEDSLDKPSKFWYRVLTSSSGEIAPRPVHVGSRFAPLTHHSWT